MLLQSNDISFCQQTRKNPKNYMEQKEIQNNQISPEP